MEHRIHSELSRIHTQDQLNNLFKHPYTRIEFIERDLGVTRQTASKYLGALSDGGILEKHTLGRSNYYVNRELFDLLSSGEN